MLWCWEWRGVRQCLKWDGMGQYGIPALRWLALNHTTTSFWRLPYIETVLLSPNAFSGLKISHTYAFVAGALPQTPLGSLQRSPRYPSWLGKERRGRKGKRDGERKGEGDERRGRGRGRVQVRTGTSFPPPGALVWDKCVRSEVNLNSRWCWAESSTWSLSPVQLPARDAACVSDHQQTSAHSCHALYHITFLSLVLLLLSGITTTEYWQVIVILTTFLCAVKHRLSISFC